MDGVIFKDINFWLELHKKFGTLEQGKALTKRYLHTNYDKLVEEVVHKLWKGKDATPYFALVNELEYLSGVKEIIQFVQNVGKLGWLCNRDISCTCVFCIHVWRQSYTVCIFFESDLFIKKFASWFIVI